MDLLTAAADVLERRRIAGTLLYGKCASHEVEWFRKRLEAGGCCTAHNARVSGPFVGYKAYLTAARIMLTSFTALYSNRPPTEPVTPPYMSVVASALDMMCERPQELIVVPNEAMLVDELRYSNSALSWLKRSDREELMAAWGRLKASGVIARRRLGQVFQVVESECKEADAKARADADVHGLRSCAHCGAKEVHVAQFKRCGACTDKGALYCSKECQVAAWPAHKAACKAARTAAAAGAARDA